MGRILSEYITLYSIIRMLAVVLVLGAFGWYALFQARFLIAGPTIAIANEPAIVQHERVVTIRGTARNVVDITLNGRNIFTNEAGAFTEEVVLPDGYTIMTLRATDRYGRVTTLTQPFMFVSSSDV